MTVFFILHAKVNILPENHVQIEKKLVHFLHKLTFRLVLDSCKCCECVV